MVVGRNPRYSLRMISPELLESPVVRPVRPQGSKIPECRLPRALLYVSDSAVACVCAWCEDKHEADAWSSLQGYDTTHTICPSCRVRSMTEFESDAHRSVA